MQQPALTPQQEAIQEVRSRYERGILTFEQFEYALNALLQAETPEQCRAIVQELPATTPTSALAMPAQPRAPAAPPAERIVGVMGELKRMRHPWRLSQHTRVLMWLGQVKLDLSLATLPQNGVLEVFVPVGEAVIYVPREVHVTVRASALIGEAKVLGEERNGIFVLLNEEVFPAQGVPNASAPHLEIRLKTWMGSVKVIRVDGPVISLKDMIKEAAGKALLAALDSGRQQRRDRTLPK